MRCMACNSPPVQMGPSLVSSPGEKLTGEQRNQLQCPSCGGWMRPHVLWFDESYDNDFFPLGRVLEEVARSSLVITAGTSGGTSLPWHVAQAAVSSGAFLIDVNPEPSPFVMKSDHAAAVACGAEEFLPKMVEWMQL